tara:strand:- start:400 stop:687 length:288 start_codon:yes stop_codon:yes gene_type:complete
MRRIWLADPVARFECFKHIIKVTKSPGHCAGLFSALFRFLAARYRAIRKAPPQGLASTFPALSRSIVLRNNRLAIRFQFQRRHCPHIPAIIANQS